MFFKCFGFAPRHRAKTFEGFWLGFSFDFLNLFLKKKKGLEAEPQRFGAEICGTNIVFMVLLKHQKSERKFMFLYKMAKFHVCLLTIEDLCKMNSV